MIKHKILVTGGAGFIGSHIVDSYIKNGHEVIVIDDLSTGQKSFVNKKAKLYICDITKKREFFDIFKKEKPIIVNHHAAYINVRDSIKKPLKNYKINIQGSINVLEAIKKFPVKKIIFASSGGAIYDDLSPIPTPESYLSEPFSPYGVAKRSIELALHSQYKTHGIPYTSLRYANVYGPRQTNGVISIFTNQIKNNLPLNINNHGLNTRDYIFINDVVVANNKALHSSYIGNINIGTGIETSTLQLIEIINSILKKSGNNKVFLKKTVEQNKSCLDISKAKSILKWKPTTSLTEGIRQTLNYI